MCHVSGLVWSWFDSKCNFNNPTVFSEAVLFCALELHIGLSLHLKRSPFSKLKDICVLSLSYSSSLDWDQR